MLLVPIDYINEITTHSYEQHKNVNIYKNVIRYDPHAMMSFLIEQPLMKRKDYSHSLIMSGLFSMKVLA